MFRQPILKLPRGEVPGLRRAAGVGPLMYVQHTDLLSLRLGNMGQMLRPVRDAGCCLPLDDEMTLLLRVAQVTKLEAAVAAWTDEQLGPPERKLVVSLASS